MNTIAERLRELRKQLGISQTDFGKKIGKNYHSVMRWELGKVLPPDNVLEHICEMFNVDCLWLAQGIGSPFQKNTVSSLREKENISYSAGDFATIPVYCSLTDNFPHDASVCGQVSVEKTSVRLFAVKAPADSAPPVMKDDIIIFSEDIKDADGKLCTVKDKFGSASVKWYFMKDNILTSKRPDYPDIQASEAVICGVVKEIIRKISL